MIYLRNMSLPVKNIFLIVSYINGKINISNAIKLIFTNFKDKSHIAFSVYVV